MAIFRLVSCGHRQISCVRAWQIIFPVEISSEIGNSVPDTPWDDEDVLCRKNRLNLVVLFHLFSAFVEKYFCVEQPESYLYDSR